MVIYVGTFYLRLRAEKMMEGKTISRKQFLILGAWPLENQTKNFCFHVHSLFLSANQNLEILIFSDNN